MFTEAKTKNLIADINNCMTQFSKYYVQAQNEYQLQYRSAYPDYHKAKLLEEQAKFELEPIDSYLRELEFINPYIGEEIGSIVSNWRNTIQGWIGDNVDAKWSAYD